MYVDQIHSPTECSHLWKTSTLTLSPLHSDTIHSGPSCTKQLEIRDTYCQRRYKDRTPRIVESCPRQKSQAASCKNDFDSMSSGDSLLKNAVEDDTDVQPAG